MEITATGEQLASSKLMLATPLYGGLCHGQYTRSMIDLGLLCQRYNIPLVVYYLSNESLITRARAYCADEFMRSDCTHLMFVDSDVGFDANDVIALLALTHMKSEYSIIGGPYPKKNISWEKIKHAVDTGHANEDPNNLEKFVGDYVFNLKSSTSFRIDEPVEVSELGTGFMMIQRKVFEEMDKQFPELLYRPDHARTDQFDGSRKIMMYFDCVIDRGYTFGDLKRLTEKMISANVDELPLLLEEADQMLSLEDKSSMRYLSEDYNFCYSAQKIGMKTWLCPWMKLSHTGTYTFGGSLADILSIGAHPTADVKKKKKGKK
jgi:hypothetical protein